MKNKVSWAANVFTGEDYTSCLFLNVVIVELMTVIIYSTSYNTYTQTHHIPICSHLYKHLCLYILTYAHTHTHRD